MRKTIFILFAALFFFVGCDKPKSFTQKQMQAFYALTGGFQAYEQDQRVAAVVSFGTRYTAPKNIADGKKTLFVAHGECSFADSRYAISEKGYNTCYYTLSEEADAISFHYKGGENNNKLLREYRFSFQSNDQFALEESGRRLQFERMK